MTATIRLGLIGDNIRVSRAPALHRLCGKMAGLDLSYDLLIPAAQGLEFDALFERCLTTGMRGLNITLPYKEHVVPRLIIDDSDIARIGACNTVLFTDNGPKGYNTDFSAFITAFRNRFGDRSPGRVVMFGAGGVGKAVAFALKRLKAEEIILIDPDRAKAQTLADAINASKKGVSHAYSGTLADLPGIDGVVNCSPLGMVGYGGSAVPDGAFPACSWAFDAVYTPVDTPFSQQAMAAGANFISGYELYYYQGVDAFEIFTGHPVSDHDYLRQALIRGADAA
ncbi:MAG: shikimate dehydrogenase family protein [Paracoccus sp. (in: a-proteobacteria)]